jgi:hypothetical protein
LTMMDSRDIAELLGTPIPVTPLSGVTGGV